MADRRGAMVYVLPHLLTFGLEVDVVDDALTGAGALKRKRNAQGEH